MLKVVFFDIDDTLIDSERAHIEAINKICVDYNLPLKNNNDKIKFSWLSIMNKYFKLFFEGKISICAQRINRIIDFWKINGLEISDKFAEEVYKQYHEHFLNSCKAFPDVIPILKSLESFQLGIISNGITSDQIFKLKYNHLYDFFDKIFISEQIGYSKPDKKIFLYAIKKMNISPIESIHIGDSYELDYLGSTNSGMNSILIDRKKRYSITKCSKIQSLLEITQIAGLNL